MFWFIWFNLTLHNIVSDFLFLVLSWKKLLTNQHRVSMIQTTGCSQIHLANWFQQCHVAVHHVSEWFGYSQCPKQPGNLYDCTQSKRINAMLNLYSLTAPIFLHKMKFVILQPAHYKPNWKETSSHWCTLKRNLWDTEMAEQLLITSPGKITSVSF